MSSQSKTVMLLALFFSCVVPATPSMAQPETGPGLEGEIWIGPIRGGPEHAGVPNSKPMAHAVFVVSQNDKVIASFETDKQGQFRVSLAPGKYAVFKKGGKGRIGSCGPFEVEVVAAQMKKVRWECDSGLR
jgi:hypothetical protein